MVGRVLLVVFGLAVVAAAAEPATRPAATQAGDVPANWEKVGADKAFWMRVPPEIREKKVQGTDSLVRQYQSDAIELSCDYGWYSDPLKYADKARFQQAAVVVGGKDAVIVSFEEPNGPLPLRAGIHFPNVTGGQGPGRTKLTVYASCRDAAAVEQAKRIFQTVTFP